MAELTDDIFEDAKNSFFDSYKEFQKISPSLSRKQLHRIINFALNDNLTDIKMQLRSEKERKVSDLLKGLMRDRTILIAGIAKKLEEQEQIAKEDNNG